MSACEGSESKYIPWSFGEGFVCLTCGRRLLQHHATRPLRGEGFDAVYPIREHEALALAAPTEEPKQP